MNEPETPAVPPRPVLVARCENFIDDDDFGGTTCLGRIHFRWGQGQAACDTCGAYCGIAVAAWERVELAGAVPDTGQARADRLADGIRRFAADCKLLLDSGGLDNRVARSIAQQERNLRALLTADSAPEQPGDTVQAPDVAAPGPAEWGPWFAEHMADEAFRDAFYKAEREYDDAHCPCGGTRWVDDEGWESRWRGDRRELGGPGRLPCGFCNHGGWDVPDPAPDRALLGTDTTPDRLAWISEAGETAAAERQARYQETACARRPAEERPDA